MTREKKPNLYHRIKKKVVVGQADLSRPTCDNHMVFYFLIFERSGLTWASLVSEMRPLARSRVPIVLLYRYVVYDTIHIVPVRYGHGILVR